MELGDFLPREAVMHDIDAGSKKQVLQAMSELAGDLTGLPQRAVFDAMLQREKLGSTGVGNGVAIPHGKFENFDRIVGVFARLKTPVPFDAIDDKPVDLIFMLLAPETAGADHLKALSRVARALRDHDRLFSIRQADDGDAIHDALLRLPRSNAA